MTKEYFVRCKNCGACKNVLGTGLCADCQRAEWDTARAGAPRKAPRSNRIALGLKLCSECGERAASLKGMCSPCYKRLRRAALPQADKDALNAKGREYRARRDAAKAQE